MRPLPVAALAFAVALAAAPAAAQVESPTEAWWSSLGTYFGLGGGPAYGETGLHRGIHAAVLLGAQPEAWPVVSLRAEGTWTDFRADGPQITTGVRSGNETDFVIVSATANVELRLRIPGFPIQPYAIGGGGFYKSSETGGAAGYNVGGGIRFPLYRVSGLLEARVHKYGEDLPGLSGRYVPVTVGVVF